MICDFRWIPVAQFAQRWRENLAGFQLGRSQFEVLTANRSRAFLRLLLAWAWMHICFIGCMPGPSKVWGWPPITRRPGISGLRIAWSVFVWSGRAPKLDHMAR